MPCIDDVLERLLTDPGFTRLLAQDPAAALAGYDLTADDLAVLSTQVSFDPGAVSLVEDRVSKSSVFGLLSTLGGLGGPDTSGGLGGPDTRGGLGGPDTLPSGGPAGHEHPGVIRGFNPQPDPPGEVVGFNPQPDPPGGAVGFNPQPDPPGEAAGFDPQPDPPKETQHLGLDPGARVGFNPQPDPPGDGIIVQPGSPTRG